MIEDAQNTIQELIKDSDIESLSFLKSGKISVKWNWNSKRMHYKTLQQVLEEIEADKLGKKIIMKTENISNSTHLLKCKHCIGDKCNYYFMKCILKGYTKSGKARILVFGERNWKNKEHIKKIRYVEISRIEEIKK